MERLEKIREFWEFQKKSLQVPETSTITTDPHVVEIIELLTQEKIDNNLWRALNFNKKNTEESYLFKIKQKASKK